MKFELEGKFVMNKDVKGIKKDIDGIMEIANETFSKSIDKDKAGKITKWSIDNESVKFHIVSGGIPRPHEIMIRLRKLMGEKLGKVQKIGVREMIVDKYIIEMELEMEPLKPIKMPYVESIEVNGKKAKLVLKKIDEEFLQKNIIDKLINLVDDKVKNQHYAGKEEFREIEWSSKEKPMKYKGDPANDMEKMGWIRRAPGKGQWVYGREVTTLFNIMRKIMIKHIYKPLGFYEMTFPKFEPWEIPKKSGHAKNVYNVAYFVMVPKDSSEENWEEVCDHFKVTGEIDKKGIMERVDCTGILSYAQCPPFWPFLQGRTIDESTLPLKTYDWSGPTYRNESGGTHGLDRLEEFHRTETLWVGTKEQEVEAWKKTKDAFRKVFDEVLDMEIRVALVAPWWMAHAGLASQKGKEGIGTFDFDAYLPYRGGRDAEWLEIQNTSSNGTKYPDAFNVKGRKEELWSGCAGGSIERWVVAFLAQKGLDPKNWPKEVRDMYQEELKGMKELKFF